MASEVYHTALMRHHIANPTMFGESMQIQARALPNPNNITCITHPPHKWRSDAFPFHAARIACLPAFPISFNWSSSLTNALLKNGTKVVMIQRAVTRSVLLGCKRKAYQTKAQWHADALTTVAGRRLGPGSRQAQCCCRRGRGRPTPC